MESEFHFGAKPGIFQHAQDLRKRQSIAAYLLWEKLWGRRFMGLKFRRQHPVDKFVVDFYCHEKKLVVEVDGGIHELPDIKEYDKGRQDELVELGLKVIRFKNEEIIADIGSVLAKVKVCLTP